MIRTDNLSKSYGSCCAVSGASIAVDRGSTLVLLGPSGGGKSTLLRLIAGFERPDTGIVEINGKVASSPNRITVPNQRHIGMIFQDLALWPHMTIFNNVAFGLRGQGLSKSVIQEKVEAVLEQVSLCDYERRFPHQLSGGEKQRLAIARTLVTKPEYLLMDEPLSSLDPILKIEISELIKSVKEKFKIGIIYVTHNIDEALNLADRMTIIKGGRLRGEIVKERINTITQDELLDWYRGEM